MTYPGSEVNKGVSGTPGTSREGLKAFLAELRGETPRPNVKGLSDESILESLGKDLPSMTWNDFQQATNGDHKTFRRLKERETKRCTCLLMIQTSSLVVVEMTATTLRRGAEPRHLMEGSRRDHSHVQHREPSR